MTDASASAASDVLAGPRPRVGFLGVGWIGRHRMEAMVTGGCVEAVGVADVDETCIAAAKALSPGAMVCQTLDHLLEQNLDGLVIATPSALHAEQAIRALEQGVAVFCQKPLGRNAAETRAVVDAARRSDRLLGVDMSYRRTRAVEAVRREIEAGSLGPIHAVDVVFHNAYGPDKAWFYDPALSGGGCLMDLGVHLADLVLWLLKADVVDADARLFAQGRPVTTETDVEDYAVASIDLSCGTTVRLACSWRVHAGCDAVIEASFFGDRGGARISNRAGSFYDFEARLFHGVSSRRLVEPPDDWGGRTAADWAARLGRSPRYDPEIEALIRVSALLDRLYAANRKRAANAAPHAAGPPAAFERIDGPTAQSAQPSTGSSTS